MLLNPFSLSALLSSAIAVAGPAPSAHDRAECEVEEIHLPSQSAPEFAPNSHDTYQNFADLASHEKEGRDFRIVTVDHHSPITILAVHGGWIEPGTSELASAIAGSDYNLYLFEGLKADHNERLHITSQKMDEPRAVRMVENSLATISIHGFFERSSSEILVGGSNLELKKLFDTEIKRGALPIQVDTTGGKFPAFESNNIANRSHDGGLQLEISTALRRQMLGDPDLLKQVASVVRETCRKYQRLHPTLVPSNASGKTNP